MILLPRPRRFGKTLNLSMLKYFFNKSNGNSGSLFEKTQIYPTDTFRHHQGQYPVIYITFKDIKQLSWDVCFGKIANLIRDCVNVHKELLISEEIDEADRNSIDRIIQRKADFYEYEDALRLLSRCLYLHYKSKVVILIDEYDTPIHAAYLKGYYDEIISFMRNFLGSGLKDNEFLYKSVLTGILRVAKESVFSGLNNLGVYTLLNRKFADVCGFTETEVRQMLKVYDIADQYETVSDWYNGYQFGDAVIYNPWSVLNYINNQEGGQPYWANTASTALIERLATRGGREIREEVGRLLERRIVEQPIYESIVMRDIDRSDNLFWSFMLFSGYLKPVQRIDHNLAP